MSDDAAAGAGATLGTTGHTSGRPRTSSRPRCWLPSCTGRARARTGRPARACSPAWRRACGVRSPHGRAGRLRQDHAAGRMAQSAAAASARWPGSPWTPATPTPRQFLRYLIAALQTSRRPSARPALPLLRSAQPPSLETVLPCAGRTTWPQLPERQLLVLDDYHASSAGGAQALDLPARASAAPAAPGASPAAPTRRCRWRGCARAVSSPSCAPQDLRFTTEEARRSSTR